MNPTEGSVYKFEDFCLDAGKRLLFRGGRSIPLSPKAFDTLLHLVRSHGEIVGKDDLMRAVWPDTAVEENNLNQNISTLRRVLGESRGENRYIATIPSRGYQFVPPVEVTTSQSRKDTRVTVAVLPFENLSANPDREYLADGLTEEVIATLGQIDPASLSVIGRTTMIAYKHTRSTLAQIGRELGADYLVESSMRSEGGRLRITSRLIRLPDQVQVWSMSYDSRPISILEFQREISTAIAERIRVQLPPERLSTIARRQTRNPEAYDLYLRGRYFWNQLSPATTRRATEFYAQATGLDPGYALAWSGLADAYTASPINGDAAPQRIWPLAREAANRAVTTDPHLAECHVSDGFVKFWLDWKWPSAVAAFRSAIHLNPQYGLAHRLLGIVLSHMSEKEEAQQAMQRAIELDPLLAGHYALASQVAFAGRDYAYARQLAKQAITVDPEFWIGHMQLGQAYEQIGEIDRALDALNTAARLSGGNSKPISLRGYLLAKTGRQQEACEVLTLLECTARERYVPPYAHALICAGMGRTEDSLDWLDRALDVHDVHLSFLPVDPKWDNLRSHPRFGEVLERCNFNKS